MIESPFRLTLSFLLCKTEKITKLPQYQELKDLYIKNLNDSPLCGDRLYVHLTTGGGEPNLLFQDFKELLFAEFLSPEMPCNGMRKDG